MDYEKKYKEALEGARIAHKDEDRHLKATLERIFPELAAEDDRIRNEIIAFVVQSIHRGGGTPIPEEQETKWIAWLEKQGKIIEEYEDKLDRAICESFDKGYKAALEKQGEIDKASYEIAEKEKQGFVSNGFIKCYADFQDFKEGATYWLEYLGNDNYNVRSDNLLGKTYHITPCQLYTIFKKQTWLEKQGDNFPILSNSSNTGKGEQKPAWSEEDEKRIERIYRRLWAYRKGDTDEIYQIEQDANWLKSIKDRLK